MTDINVAQYFTREQLTTLRNKFIDAARQSRPKSAHPSR